MDLISRQAAIDAVSESLIGLFVEHEDIAQKMINKVPSAETEIIRCKDCRWKYKNNCTRAVELFIHDEDFCSWAERKQDG